MSKVIKPEEMHKYRFGIDWGFSYRLKWWQKILQWLRIKSYRERLMDGDPGLDTKEGQLLSLLVDAVVVYKKKYDDKSVIVGYKQLANGDLEIVYADHYKTD